MATTVQTRCGFNMLDNLTPQSYLKACVYFDAQPISDKSPVRWNVNPDHAKEACVPVDRATIGQIEATLKLCLHLHEEAKNMNLFQVSSLLQSDKLNHIASIAHEFGFYAGVAQGSLHRRMEQGWMLV